MFNIALLVSFLTTPLTRLMTRLMTRIRRRTVHSEKNNASRGENGAVMTTADAVPYGNAVNGTTSTGSAAGLDEEKSCSFIPLQIKERMYFLCKSTLERAHQWLDLLTDSTAPRTHRVLIVNGMIKTGKTTFSADILPYLVRQRFSDALIWYVDCECQLCCASSSTFGHSLVMALDEFMRNSKITDPYVNSLVNKYVQSNPEVHPFCYYMDCVRLSIKALSSDRRLFVVLDEFQKWFQWDHTLTERESAALHGLFKGFVLSRNIPNANFILTGSAMGSAWNHVMRCAPNDLPLFNAFALNLPGSVSDEMYQAVADTLKSEHPTDIVANIAPHCDNSHALLTFLVDVAVTLEEQLELCTNLDAARNFCYEQISAKIFEEMWKDDRHVLGSLRAQERKFFRRLVSASGLSEEEFEYDTFGGWRRHLQPFCKVIKVPGEEGRRYCLQSVLFRAFVHHFIDENGILVNEPGTLHLKFDSPDSLL